MPSPTLRRGLDAELGRLAFPPSPLSGRRWRGQRRTITSAGRLVGANPIAAVFPPRVEAPFSINLSALDREGNPATDPEAGFKDTMQLARGMKGAGDKLWIG